MLAYRCCCCVAVWWWHLAGREETKSAPKSNAKDIWDGEDVPELADVEDEHETRPRPKYDWLAAVLSMQHKLCYCVFAL